MQDLQTLLDAARKWRSSGRNATSLQQVPDIAKIITRDQRAWIAQSNRECFAHYKHISYFFNKYSLSLGIHPTNARVPCLFGGNNRDSVRLSQRGSPLRTLIPLFSGWRSCPKGNRKRTLSNPVAPNSNNRQIARISSRRCSQTHLNANKKQKNLFIVFSILCL